MLFQFGHLLMTMLFVAMTDAYQKYTLLQFTLSGKSLKILAAGQK
jgi:hypothetical protein